MYILFYQDDNRIALQELGYKVSSQSSHWYIEKRSFPTRWKQTIVPQRSFVLQDILFNKECNQMYIMWSLPFGSSDFATDAKLDA